MKPEIEKKNIFTQNMMLNVMSRTDKNGIDRFLKPVFSLPKKVLNGKPVRKTSVFG